MTALDKIKEVSALLESKGIENAAKEAETFITETLQIDASRLYAESLGLSEDEARQIDALVSRRAQREPLQYILGHVEFYGLKINVGKGVLIPRPETELLAEEVIKAISNQLLAISEKKISSCCQLNILDLCTGSGCLALALAKNFPDAKVIGTDISAPAIKYARENAKLNNINNATFFKGSLYEPLNQLISAMPLKFDIVVSNPPYIRSNDIFDLEPEVSKWEPKNALDGGEDGLRYYRDILKDARKYLMPGGSIFLEVGEGQACEVSEIAAGNFFRRISVIKDYAGIERIVVIVS